MIGKLSTYHQTETIKRTSEQPLAECGQGCLKGLNKGQDPAVI